MKKSKRNIMFAAIALIVILALGAVIFTKGGSMKDIVVFETSMGNFEVELDAQRAPKTVANFKQYVQQGFFDGLVFHRVIPGFMVQGGGFSPNGEQKQTGAPIPLESNNGIKNAAGTIAMARTSDPDSATSQFFINVKDNAFLDYAQGNAGYTAFGRVISGMDVVYAIEKVPTTTKFGMYQDRPQQDVIITRAYMRK